MLQIRKREIDVGGAGGEGERRIRLCKRQNAPSAEKFQRGKTHIAALHLKIYHAARRIDEGALCSLIRMMMMMGGGCRTVFYIERWCGRGVRGDVMVREYSDCAAHNGTVCVCVHHIHCAV